MKLFIVRFSTLSSHFLPPRPHLSSSVPYSRSPLIVFPLNVRQDVLYREAHNIFFKLKKGCHDFRD